MSHSRAANATEDLEHLDLTQEVAAAQEEDARSEEQYPSPRPPPHSQKDTRRVSISSLSSNISSSTAKYHPQEDQAYSGVGGATPGPRLSSAGSTNDIATPKRSRPSYRLQTGDNATPSGSRRRRHAQGRRPPGSSRSSIRQRNRSSDEDNNEDSQDDEIDDYFGDVRSYHSRLRRTPSRRSNRLSPSRDYDDRSVGHSGRSDDNGEDGDETDKEPLTLKDRQEVKSVQCAFRIFHSIKSPSMHSRPE